MSPPILAALLCLGFSPPTAPPRADDPPPWSLVDVLALAPGGGPGGRSVLRVDPVQARVVAGSFAPPRAGETVAWPGGASRTWEPVTPGPEGQIDHPAARGGYVHATVAAAADAVAILEARGHGVVLVNGEPRPGDPYDQGDLRLPVQLREGSNALLFQGGRGTLRVRLVSPRAPLALDLADATWPDLLAGDAEPAWAALPLLNATGQPTVGLVLEVHREGAEPIRTALPVVPALSARKVPFRLPPAAGLDAGTECEVSLRLRREGDPADREPLDRLVARLRVRRPDEPHRRTFVSRMDGSVQFYAVRPALPLAPDDPPPSLVLTLHGAGVDALGQVEAYGPRSWAHLVAPTNRRPFGFDWEGPGRQDALEVLEEAQRHLRHDPARVYLTGHSMGGHGTWNLGTTDPDRFAAIAPSAGWISFNTYSAGRRRGEAPDPFRALLERAGGSDPSALATNLADLGVYILHGDADDNVPASEARAMADRLGSFHHDWQLHLQPGAGHWWDASPEPGADCVDWAPAFDLFARHVRPDPRAVRAVDFATINPADSSRRHWAEVLQQQRPLGLSRIQLLLQPSLHRISGRTENVARLALDLSPLRPGEPVRVALDGQPDLKIDDPDASGRLVLARGGDGTWTASDHPDPSQKSPLRGGPFRRVLDGRFLIVYGTHGDAAENARLAAKARFDAETWRYRGNGSLDVLPDTAFDPVAEPDRNVVLIGNATTNAAWAALLEASPVQVIPGAVRLGTDRSLAGDNLACLLLRPRPHSERALVAAVAGTGPIGTRLADRLPYFQSGVAVPDLLVIDPTILDGDERGLRAVAYFGNDWSLEPGECLTRSP